MKRNAFLSAVAVTSLFAVSACGGEATDAPATEDTAEDAATADTATAEEATAEEAAPAPAVEPNGTILEVQMYTKDPDDPTGMQVFKPRLIKAKVGDTIKFVPTNPTHQSVSIAGMLPEGVEGWEGKINEEVSYVVPKPGVYGYKCNPHYAAGMVGLIVVEGEGSDANVEAAKGVSHPGLAGREFDEIFTEAGL